MDKSQFEDTQSRGRAIETEWRGLRFRSRLEARWAVFFDALGIEYQYEPQGFERDYGDKVIRWLPDFYLPNSGTWVEVKGYGRISDTDRDKMIALLDFDSPLTGVCESWGDGRHCGGLLLLGDIPDVSNWWGHVYHPLIQHHKGLVATYAEFHPGSDISGVRWVDPVVCEYIYGHWNTDEEAFDPRDVVSADRSWCAVEIAVPSKRAYKRVLAAYRIARCSRFEYGYRDVIEREIAELHKASR